jgi:hypothetical protein
MVKNPTTTIRSKNPICADTNIENIEKWTLKNPREDSCVPPKELLVVFDHRHVSSVVEPFGVECTLNRNGTTEVIWKLYDRELSEEAAESATSPEKALLDNVVKLHPQYAQIHEVRQEACTRNAIELSGGEHFRGVGNDDEEGREENQRDADLQDQCPLQHRGSLLNVVCSERSHPVKDSSKQEMTIEQEMTPQKAFYHLHQLYKLYKNDVLTDEEYARSRKRLWAKLAVAEGPAGQSPEDKRQETAKKEKELCMHLDRLHQLCQDGVMTENQYCRARDRIINKNIAKDESSAAVQMRYLPSEPSRSS